MKNNTPLCSSSLDRAFNNRFAINCPMSNPNGPYVANSGSITFVSEGDEKYFQYVNLHE